MSQQKRKTPSSRVSDQKSPNKKTKNEPRSTCNEPLCTANHSSNQPEMLIELTQEKAIATRILESVLPSSPSSATNGSSKKPITTAVSANWEKLKATLPPSRKSRKSHSTNLEPPKTATVRQQKKKKKPIAEIPSASDDMSLTKYLALDCEMVGAGENGAESLLARVSIVNTYGNCVYDRFVLATEKVTDYRTRWSGIRKEDLVPGKAVPFKQVQKEVADIIQGRILVGHALHNDLKVLFLPHPFNMMRDTSKYRPLQRWRGRPKALRDLAATQLGVQIQEGEHSSIDDARAAMLVFQKHKKEWEQKVDKRRVFLKQRSKSKRKKSALSEANGLSLEKIE